MGKGASYGDTPRYLTGEIIVRLCRGKIFGHIGRGGAGVNKVLSDLSVRAVAAAVS